MKGLRKLTKRLMDTGSSIVIARGKGAWGEVEEDKGGVNCDGKRLN